MRDQHRYEPLEASAFFDDGRSARPPVPGTVARGQLRADEALTTGRVDGKLLEEIPLEVTDSTLARGRERFEIFCSPCHGRTGTGQGMVVRRGFRQPQTFHSHRLRQMPVGYFFDVMTNGYGVMSSYAHMVPVEDRWAIAAYVRALQLSQYAPVDRLPGDDRKRLEGVQR
jgi:mono/diheme cytochrome c family protein